MREQGFIPYAWNVPTDNPLSNKQENSIMVPLHRDHYFVQGTHLIHQIVTSYKHAGQPIEIICFRKMIYCQKFTIIQLETGVNQPGAMWIVPKILY